MAKLCSMRLAAMDQASPYIHPPHVIPYSDRWFLSPNLPVASSLHRASKMSAQGWVAEKYSANDKPYRSRLKGVYKHRIDLSEGHPTWLEPAYTQFDTESCVANATAAAYRFLAYREGEEARRPTILQPSRLFLYYNARILPLLVDLVGEEHLQNAVDTMPATQVPDVYDTGSENRDCFRALNLFGVCDEHSWPFENVGHTDKIKNIDKQPKAELYREAKLSHAIEYCRLDPDHPEEMEKGMSDAERAAVGTVTLMQLKQCLTEGYPVVFGFWLYWDVEKLPWIESEGLAQLPEVPKEQQHKGPPMRPNGNTMYGGHTVLAIGYDESRAQVLCQNSWGPEWSKNGKFWMPYSWILDWEATDDFWMIRLIERKRKE